MSTPHFTDEPHPDHPGWHRWRFADETRYNSLFGELMVRLECGAARVRMVPERRHSNLGDRVHGGAILGFVDQALFVAARSLDLIPIGRALTIDLTTHFVGAGAIDRPLDAVVEVTRETGKLLFLRGLVVQGDDTIADFSGTIKKPSDPKSSSPRA